MKNTIKILSTVLMTVLLSQFALAQRAGGEGRVSPEERLQKQTEMMVEKLELDETQAAKIKVINEKYAEKIKSVMESNKDDREAMREEREGINESRLAEYKTVLTADQLAKFEEMQSKRGDREKEGGKNKRRG